MLADCVHTQTIEDLSTFPHCWNKLTRDLAETLKHGVLWYAAALFIRPLSTSEVHWSTRLRKQSLLLTRWLHRWIHYISSARHATRRNSSVISGKTDTGELVQGREEQNNTISPANAILSVFKHPALKLQDVDVAAQPDIMPGLPVRTGRAFTA